MITALVSLEVDWFIELGKATVAVISCGIVTLKSVLAANGHGPGMLLSSP